MSENEIEQQVKIDLFCPEAKQKNNNYFLYCKVCGEQIYFQHTCVEYPCIECQNTGYMFEPCSHMQDYCFIPGRKVNNWQRYKRRWSSMVLLYPHNLYPTDAFRYCSIDWNWWNCLLERKEFPKL